MLIQKKVPSQLEPLTAPPQSATREGLATLGSPEYAAGADLAGRGAAGERIEWRKRGIDRRRDGNCACSIEFRPCARKNGGERQLRTPCLCRYGWNLR